MSCLRANLKREGSGAGAGGGTGGSRGAFTSTVNIIDFPFSFFFFFKEKPLNIQNELLLTFSVFQIQKVHEPELVSRPGV